MKPSFKPKILSFYTFARGSSVLICEILVNNYFRVTAREDESRIRKGKAPENFAVLRHIALNMIKKETSSKKSIKSKRLRAGWDNEYLVKVLAS